MNKVLQILVPAREHANQDSLPLRFGIHFSVDTNIEIFDCIDLGVDDRFNDRHHYDGYLRNPLDPKCKPLFGHFIIGNRQRENLWALVTAWRNSNQEDEYYLSNTLRNLRTDGILTPKMLLTMHPNYTSGEINSSASLIKHLSKTLAKDEIAKAKAAEERARIDTEQALNEMKLAREEAEKAKRDAEHARSVAKEAINVVEELEVKVTKAEQAEQEVRTLLEEALAAIRESDKNQAGLTEKITLDKAMPARSVTAVWKSKTGSEYRNVGLEAAIISIKRVGNKININFIDRDDSEKSVEDFGYQGFIEPVFEYLSSRVGKRAVFLVTQKPGNDVKLASDTMMLPAYRGLWS